MATRGNTTFKTTTEWLLNGDTGLSSESLLAAGLSIEKEGSWSGYQTPSDPSDLNRCIIFADNFPGIAQSAFEEYKIKGGELKIFAENYERIKSMFIAEVGYNWCDGKIAKKTYKEMKNIGL